MHCPFSNLLGTRGPFRSRLKVCRNESHLQSLQVCIVVVVVVVVVLIAEVAVGLVVVVVLVVVVRKSKMVQPLSVGWYHSSAMSTIVVGLVDHALGYGLE